VAASGRLQPAEQAGNAAYYANLSAQHAQSV